MENFAEKIIEGKQNHFVYSYGTINRNSTVAVNVFHGASEPRKAYLAIMWTILGQPIASVALPVWVMVSEIPAPLTQGPTAPPE